MQARQGVVRGADRRRLREVARCAGELLEIGKALRRLVEVESRVADMFDVRRDAETEDEHQHSRTDEGEGEAHGIAQDLHRLVRAIGEHSS